MEHQTAGVALWVPALVFAHAFALLWLIKALARVRPGVGERLWEKLSGKLLFWRAGGAPPKARLPRPRSGDVWHADEHRVPTLLLEWEGLGCEYSTPSGPKTVLKDVSGEARPYELLALMGPSGAGKSTLLDILAARKSVGRLTGRVAVNGAPRGSSFARHVSYVPQEDTFLPTMTVAETCALHAALTLPRGTPAAQTAERISEVLAAMGMLHASDTLVGGVLPGGLCLRGLSGGERKRVSVAVGILAAPSIIFLDEPTSGLDSCSALSVVEHLRDRARDSGLTIVASIHQPRAAVWAAFDRCCLLSGGMLLYAGECGALVPWFESLGCGPWRADVHGTSCDWVMDLVNVGFAGKTQLGGSSTISTREELATAAARFVAHYREARKAAAAEAAAPPATAGGKAAAYKAAAAWLSGGAARSGGGGGGGPPSEGSDDAAGERDAAVVISAGGSSGPGSDAEPPAPRALSVAAPPDKRRRPSWLAVFRALLWREMLGTVRNPADVAGRMLLFAWMGVFCGLVFWRAGDAGGAGGARDRFNLLFIMAQQFLLMPYVYLSLYAADKRHYTADIGARLYTPSPYYAAKTLAVLPFVVAQVLVNSLIAYGMTGLRMSGGAIAVNGAASVLLYLIGQQIQSFASIVMPNEDASFLLTIVWSATNLYFSNFIVRFQDMAFQWLSYLRYLSAVNFAFSAYLRAEFYGAELSCGGGIDGGMLAGLRELLPKTPLLRSETATRALTNPGPGCVMDMDAALSYYGMTQPTWTYLLALVMYLMVVHASTFLGLLLLARKERR